MDRLDMLQAAVKEVRDAADMTTCLSVMMYGKLKKLDDNTAVLRLSAALLREALVHVEGKLKDMQIAEEEDTLVKEHYVSRDGENCTTSNHIRIWLNEKPRYMANKFWLREDKNGPSSKSLAASRIISLEECESQYGWVPSCGTCKTVPCNPGDTQMKETPK